MRAGADAVTTCAPPTPPSPASHRHQLHHWRRCGHKVTDRNGGGTPGGGPKGRGLSDGMLCRNYVNIAGGGIQVLSYLCGTSKPARSKSGGAVRLR
jgi:hypothetical protein